MAKFSTKTKARSPKVTRATTNLAGGSAYTMDAKEELVGILLTSMVGDKFYESAEDQVGRLEGLMDRVDPLFAAKAAVFARNEYGMRSISHVAAAKIANMVKGEAWTRRFFNAVVRRPDDMTEIVALYLGAYGKPVPNSLKKGFAEAFGKFDAYQIAKYRGEGRDVSLVDVVNLVHPRASEKNAEALRALVAGTLRSENTWESKLSEAGKAGDETAKAKAKEEAWTDLLKSGRMPYMAALRNINNVMTQAPELVTDLCSVLTNEKMIRKALIFPHQFLTAYAVAARDRKIKKALNEAVDISLGNIPALSGKTLVAVDHSGSMGEGIGSSKFIGDLFGAAMFKAQDGDMLVFGDRAGIVTDKFDAGDSTLSIAERLGKINFGHGTSFEAIFSAATERYDRVVIFSDMQAWLPDGSVRKDYYYRSANSEGALGAYKKRTGADPFLYAFDLGGYGTQQFINGKFVQVAGFSEKVFDLMGSLETDRRALINKIEAVTF